MRKLWDGINLGISRLNSIFVSLVYAAASSRELVENMVSKIGHKEFREEAEMHSRVIREHVEKLDAERLSRPGFDVLSDEAYGATGIMTELEKRRRLVEELLQSDRSRRNLTMGVVTGYVALMIGLVVLFVVRGNPRLAIGDTALSELRLPVLGIPWPVLVWSLIGSFAAMIYRFNANPIYDFGDALKWMLTRPVQGVVMGSAMYLILVSGLFVLMGSQPDQSAGLIGTDEILLALSFLVGFSDRFANSVFEALVKRYTDASENSQLAEE